MTITKGRPASTIAASGILCAAQAVAAGESSSFSYVASLVYDYTTLERAARSSWAAPGSTPA